MEKGEEDDGIFAEDLAGLVVQRTKNRNVLKNRISVGHDCKQTPGSWADNGEGNI